MGQKVSTYPPRLDADYATKVENEHVEFFWVRFMAFSHLHCAACAGLELRADSPRFLLRAELRRWLPVGSLH